MGLRDKQLTGELRKLQNERLHDMRFIKYYSEDQLEENETQGI